MTIEHLTLARVAGSAIALIALFAVIRLLRYQQDTQHICADDPSASVCGR